MTVLFSLLEKLCWYKVGHNQIFHGFTYIQQELAEPFIYFTLYDILQIAILKNDAKLILKILNFADSYVNLCPDTEQKIYLQYVFKITKISVIFNILIEEI